MQSTQAIFQAGKQRDLIKESLEKPPLHAHSCRKEEVVISVVYVLVVAKGMVKKSKARVPKQFSRML